MVTEQVSDYLGYTPVAASERGSRGLSSTISSEWRRVGYWGRGLAGDEQHGAFRPLEQFRRNLAKEEVVAGSRTYTYHQKTVATLVELMENGVLRCAGAAHGALDPDSIMFPQLDNLADDGVGTRRRCERGTEAMLP